MGKNQGAWAHSLRLGLVWGRGRDGELGPIGLGMLWQPSLPRVYRSMSSDELAAAISDRRARLGEKLIILGHHYQVDSVIRHADFRGDSLKLSQLAAEEAEKRGAEFIVFCGVHFMAETADMLTPESVRVILPDMSAGCSMADMADYDDTVQAWETLPEAMRIHHFGDHVAFDVEAWHAANGLVLSP